MSSTSGQLFSVVHQGERFDLCLLHAQREKHSGAVRFQHAHTHDVYHAVLYLAGSNTFSLRDELHEAAPGVLALASPGEPHEFRPRRAESVEYTEITFELRSASRALHLPWAGLLSYWFGQSFPALVTPVRPPAALRLAIQAALAALGRTLATPSADAPFARARNLLDLAELLPRACGQCPQPEPIEVRLLRSARHLDTLYPRSITVPELARMAGLSPSHFARSFTKHFGRSPIDYLLDRRIQAARELLQHTPLPLRVIAREVGFSDEFYFSRQFRKRCGHPPGFLRSKP